MPGQVIYIKDRERRKGQFQFYMHQFVDACKEAGIPWRKEIVVTDFLKIGGIYRRLAYALYKIRNKQSFDKAIIVTSRGADLFASAAPYFLHYEIIPMLWDVWPETWNNLFQWFDNLHVRTVLVTVKSFAEEIRRRTDIHAIWVPEGIDVAPYMAGPNLEERQYDVYELGRQHPEYHQVLEGLDKTGTLHGFFHNIVGQEGKLVKLAFPSNDELYATMPQIKVVVNFPKTDTDSQHAGGLETLTQRYWEAMLCKCLIVGRAPRELTELAKYNPVVDVDWSDPKHQLLDILSNLTDYQALVDENYELALKMASWNSRMDFIFEKLGLLGYKICRI